MPTVQEWCDHYIPLLRGSGVSEQDALKASLFGADIIYVHQACYGDDNTPIRYYVCEQAHPELPNIIAACRSRRLDGVPDAYEVYPIGIVATIDIAMQLAGGLVHESFVRLALAVHEVRHMVQGREPSVRQFRREHLKTMKWTDAQAIIITSFVDQQYVEDEESLRRQGIPERLIAWALSDREFDADVVERLFLHRARSSWTPDQIASHVRIHAPILLP